MMLKRILLSLCCSLVMVLGLLSPLIAQQPQTFLYKSLDTVELTLDVYRPENYQAGKLYPAIVFYFGGGWVGGSKAHFKPQSEFFAKRGMVCITVDYRIRSKHGTHPSAAIRDARDAMRWVKTHAGDLGIDPTKIIASGGSAGGHLALCTALISGFDPPGYMGPDPFPSALILFNPVVNTTQAGYGATKMGPDSLRASPFHHIRPGLPPTLIFHGTEDTTVPFQNIVDFQARMRAYGNYCKVSSFPGKQHGFFNKGRGDGLDYMKTLVRTDKFIRLLGYL